MTKHTIVIDFTGAKQPAYGSGMEALGGKVVAVAFADELERAEQLESQRDELLEALEGLLAAFEEALVDEWSEPRETWTDGGAWHSDWHAKGLKAIAAIAKARGEA